MILFRPVGLNELRLLFESGLRRFPPRLPEQPIFYPVLDEAYARQIARDWNTKSETHAGFVTRFSVDDAYGHRFQRQRVGGKEHEELWVPAEELAEFNDHIEGRIEIIDAYFGDAFSGDGASRDDVENRFVTLASLLEREDFEAIRATINADPAAFFLEFPYWEQMDASDRGIGPDVRDDLLVALRRAWAAEGRAATPIGCRLPRTIADVEALLPWGLHDAYLEAMNVDWIHARSTLRTRVMISERQDRDQRCEIDVEGLVFCVIDPPAAQETSARTPGGLWIDAGEGAKYATQPLPSVPDDCFVHWFFVRSWNAYIHVCGRGVAVRWLDAAPVAARSAVRALLPGDEIGDPSAS